MVWELMPVISRRHGAINHLPEGYLSAPRPNSEARSAWISSPLKFNQSSRVSALGDRDPLFIARWIPHRAASEKSSGGNTVISNSDEPIGVIWARGSTAVADGRAPAAVEVRHLDPKCLTPIHDDGPVLSLDSSVLPPPAGGLLRDC